MVFPNIVSGIPKTYSHKSSQLKGCAVTTGQLSRHSIFREDSLSISSFGHMFVFSGGNKVLTLVEKQKLRWFGHILRSSGLAKTILQE